MSRVLSASAQQKGVSRMSCTQVTCFQSRKRPERKWRTTKINFPCHLYMPFVTWNVIFIGEALHFYAILFGPLVSMD